MYQYMAGKNELAATANTLLLRKAFNTGLWENSRQAARQLDGIGPKIASLMEKGGICTLEDIKNADPRRIEV
mgnify:CR=1 FL=1